MNRLVRRMSLVGLLVALVPVLLLAARPAPTATAAVAAPVRIMPLGDSITGSPGCWRALLWNRLQSTGFTDIDFVGTLPPQGCGIPYDGDNEGHGGILASGIVSQNLLPGWLAATSPNIVLMHLGTNDVWNGQSPTRILASYTTLIGQMRANNPNMTVLVAQIIPMNPTNCTTCAQGVINLDAAIPAWAPSLSTSASPVVVVDQWTGFNDATDTVDGVHPNDSGNQKMSDRWYTPHLADLGHRRIAHIEHHETNPVRLAEMPNAVRADGYRQAMRARGLAEDITVVSTSYTQEGGYLGTRQLLAMPTRPTAIFAGADIAAMGVLEALAEAGLSVPDDMSVAGYDNTNFAALGQISLTSVDKAGRHIGATAARLVLERIADRGILTARVTISPTLIPRRTTAAPPE